jgi:hypothetical protein
MYFLLSIQYCKVKKDFRCSRISQLEFIGLFLFYSCRLKIGMPYVDGFLHFRIYKFSAFSFISGVFSTSHSFKLKMYSSLWSLYFLAFHPYILSRYPLSAYPLISLLLFIVSTTLFYRHSEKKLFV